jgi:hypothetical protein
MIRWVKSIKLLLFIIDDKKEFKFVLVYEEINRN